MGSLLRAAAVLSSPKLISTRTALACLSVALLACGGRSRDSSEEYRCPDCNVVLISIDTLRADHLSLYGYERPTSPNLEALAREAVVFENMFNNGGGTLPVHMSMFTSLAPLEHNVLPQNGRVLEPERITLAEQIGSTGYSTAAFTDGGWMKGKFGFAQGFELFEDSGGRLATILPKALEWLRHHRDERFFLFLHTYDVHSGWKSHPYDCPGDYPLRYAPDYEGDFSGCFEGRCASRLFLWLNEQIKSGNESVIDEILSSDDLAFVVARYDGCINYVDDVLDQFFGELRELSIYDDTMIIVTSDHGEEFREHGLLLHQNRAYEELIHIPLVIKFPRSRFAGRRVEGLAAVIDLMPTILDVLGISPHDQVAGRSLMPLLTAGRPVRRSNFIYSSVRTERWKFLVRDEEGFLFDLEKDPEETLNLAEQRPELASRMRSEARRVARGNRRRFAEFLEGRGRSEETVQLTDEEIEALRALGYLR